MNLPAGPAVAYQGALPEHWIGMSPSLRLPALNRMTKVLLGVLLALTALVVLFEWNWLRAPAERFFSENSGRAVKIGHLDVDIDLSLVPTVRLRDVYVENAPWASKQPFVVAGDIAITISLKSVWQGRPVISRLVIGNAEISMERTADGLRNWRLREPDNRGPGRTKVLVLEARQTQLRFVNRQNGLEFTAATSPLSAARDGFTTQLNFEGIYAGARFTAEALNAGLVSFRESGVAFPARGHITSGKTRLEIDGSFTDIFDLGPMNAALHLTGPTLSQLHPFLRMKPPPSRPFDLRAQLVQRDHVYKFSNLKGKIGDTDLAGQAVFDRSGERRKVEADLVSASADLADLRALAGLPPPQGTSGGSGSAEAGRGGMFPSRPFAAEKLKSFDVRVSLNARKLKAANAPMLDSLRIVAHLNNGTLELKPIDLGIAGGQLSGSLTLNTRREPATANAAIEFRDVRLERLAPSLAEKTRGAGAIRGHIRVSGAGNSMAAIVANANGSMGATMARGRISNMADAKLGLDLLRIAGAFLRGERDNAVHCGAIAFDIRNGVGKSQLIVLDTELTHVAGSGTIDLRNEQLDLTLTPDPKNPGLFTRRASIRLQGPFKNVKTALGERVEQPRAAATEGCNG